LKITDVLKITLQVEAEAERIIEEAKLKAKDILVDAETLSEKKYKETYEETLQRRREEINQQIEKGKLEAEEYAKNILAGVDKDIDNIRSSSSKNVKKAVNVLLEEITKLGLA